MISRRGESDSGATAVMGILFVLLLMFGGCAGAFIEIGATYSEGFRDGQLQKFSHKGLIVQSWEGELATSGFRPKGSDGAVSNVFEFSVDDPEIISTLQKLPQDTRIRVHYRQVFHNAWMYHATGYRATRIEMLK